MEIRTFSKTIQDVGFGKTAEQTQLSRLLNRDGTFNVEKIGRSTYQAFSPYHDFLVMRWPSFFSVVALLYISTNVLFASLYYFCGPDAFIDVDFKNTHDRFFHCFFFSVQTMSTIGYGSLSPGNALCHLLVLLESITGLFFVALVTGLVFARFARPVAKILFSKVAVIAPFKGHDSLQFRMANLRKNQLFEAEVEVIYTHLEKSESGYIRRYDRLSLFIERIVFFPLYWTVTHIIDESSPLYGVTPDVLEEQHAEILILFKAVDESFSDTVYKPCSYRYDDILFGQRFESMYVDLESVRPKIDMQALSAVRPLSS